MTLTYIYQSRALCTSKTNLHTFVGFSTDYVIINKIDDGFVDTCDQCVVRDTEMYIANALEGHGLAFPVSPHHRSCFMSKTLPDHLVNAQCEERGELEVE